MSGNCYRTSSYWEWALTQKDIWQGFLVSPEKVRNPIVLNCSLIDSKRKVLDNNWACYPNLASILGFIQYVFLPTVFHFLSHPTENQLWIPIQTNQEFMEELFASQHPKSIQMARFLDEINTLWTMEYRRVYRALPKFCKRLEEAFSQEGLVLHIRPFFNTFEVSGYLQEILWCDEVFKEDIGITPRQFEEFCQRFYQDALYKVFFIRFLNHRVGCVV